MAETRNEFVEVLLEQNALLREQNALLMQLLGITPDSLKKLFGSLIENQESDSLTPEQEQLFTQLEAHTETDDVTRMAVQTALEALKGQDISKVLVRRLQTFLKDREWGIQTDKQIPAAPVWQADKGSPRGGYMRLSYTDPETGRGTQTKSFSFVPAMELVSRPDARKQRNA